MHARARRRLLVLAPRPDLPAERGWFVEDLGSTNGTYLEGHRLEAPVPVQPGEEIRIGQTTMVLQG
nr:FHA domain-containing protein [Luteimicrobium album]